MAGAWEIVGSGLGAVATLAGVLAGGRIGSRSQERQWGRDAGRDACGDVLRGYAVIYSQFSHWARRGEEPDIDWPEWNRALSLVRLVAPPAVVAAADAMDAELWVISRELRGGRVGLERWLHLREPLEARHLEFVNAARESLVPGTGRLTRAVGRPPESHAMWQVPGQAAQD
ncbi:MULTISPECIES: hypothetical protein [Kitasatospora]|uniref:Uncharacterized protein n=2 Tax=Kitasatospora TaxID=2063 RepID=A0ABT1J7R4_9ACTN|nr:hypothetical protein [Kitasatospora paracochleata]MCP2313478.1 hypothetical protein [Kitasatospora paracochleata]